MKIAIIGYGKMGRIIESIALDKGHTVGSCIDIDNQGIGVRDQFFEVFGSGPKTMWRGHL